MVCFDPIAKPRRVVVAPKGDELVVVRQLTGAFPRGHSQVPGMLVGVPQVLRQCADGILSGLLLVQQLAPLLAFLPNRAAGFPLGIFDHPNFPALIVGRIIFFFFGGHCLHSLQRAGSGGARSLVLS